MIAKKRSKTASHDSAPIPPGLTSLSLSLPLSVEEVDQKSIRNLASQYDSLELTEKGGLRGLLASDRTYPRMHGHLSIARDKAAQTIEYELLMFSSRQTVPKGATALHLSESMSRTGVLVKDATIPRPGIIAATFYFKQDEWRPIIELPFSAPNVVQVIPGLPQIAGVDFAFPASSPQQPLIRAFVSTYPKSKQFVVKMILGLNLTFSDESLTLALNAAAQNVMTFARNRRGGDA
jgi:hypothetical protein